MAPPKPTISLRLSTGCRGSVPAGGSTAGGSGGVGVVASAYGAGSGVGSDGQSCSGTFIVGCSVIERGDGCGADSCADSGSGVDAGSCAHVASGVASGSKGGGS